MNDLISVIIPVYNVEKYLHRCIDSVINQTYSNLEIILVDDGSTDTSPEICDEYKNLDERIVVIHKKNGGLSDARNVGFDISKGEYILFLDSDDWMVNNALEKMCFTMQNRKADIIVSNYYYNYDVKNIIAFVEKEDKSFNRSKAIEELLLNKEIKNFAWGKLYRRNVVDGILFPIGKLFEDVYWAHLVFNRIDKLILLSEPLFYYRQRADSISYNFSLRKLNILEGTFLRRKFIKQEWPEYLYLIDNSIMSLILGLYKDSLKHFKFSTYYKVKKILKDYSSQLIENMSEGVDKYLLDDFRLFNMSSILFVLKQVYKKGRKR